MVQRLSGGLHPVVVEQGNNIPVPKETKILSACSQKSTIGVRFEKAHTRL
jgi:hypothetical protein